jgi:hypothetical protein
MSIEADNPEHELETEELLLQILRELRLQTLIMKETFEQHDIKMGDLDE